MALNFVDERRTDVPSGQPAGGVTRSHWEMVAEGLQSAADRVVL